MDAGTTCPQTKALDSGTVDGSEIANNLTCMKPCKITGYLPYQLAIFSINSMDDGTSPFSIGNTSSMHLFSIAMVSFPGYKQGNCRDEDLELAKRSTLRE